MRCAFLLAAGCSFQPGSLGTADGSADDAEPDAPRDGSPLPCSTTRVWLADFTTDPTALNLNGDGVSDWAMRDMGTLPGTLAGGIWAEPGTPTRPLDSQPKQDFATPTRVDLRMRNSARAGSYGALFWINVDYTSTTFAPLYVNMQLTSDGTGQAVTLYGKSDRATAVELAQMSVFPFDFIDVSLDIRPAANQVIVTVASASMARTYTEISRNANDDRWATAVAYGADAEFDLVRVEVCDP